MWNRSRLRVVEQPPLWLFRPRPEVGGRTDLANNKVVGQFVMNPSGHFARMFKFGTLVNNQVKKLGQQWL